jgi:hypothetical protein
MLETKPALILKKSEEYKKFRTCIDRVQNLHIEYTPHNRLLISLHMELRHIKPQINFRTCIDKGLESYIHRVLH